MIVASSIMVSENARLVSPNGHNWGHKCLRYKGGTGLAAGSVLLGLAN